MVFIRKARGLGLSLADITEVFDTEQGAGRCDTVRTLLHARIDEIDARMTQLAAAQERLQLPPRRPVRGCIPADRAAIMTAATAAGT